MKIPSAIPLVAGMIVDHRCQPRAGHRAVGVEDADIEQGVIGRPCRAGAFRSVPMHQFVPITECGVALMSKCQHSRTDAAGDCVNARIRWGDLPRDKQRFIREQIERIDRERDCYYGPVTAKLCDLAICDSRGPSRSSAAR